VYVFHCVTGDDSAQSLSFVGKTKSQTEHCTTEHQPHPGVEDDLYGTQFCAVNNCEGLQQLIIPDSKHRNCDDSPNARHIRAKLPQFEHFLRSPTSRPITELDGSSVTSETARPITELGVSTDVDQLDTEKVEFGNISAQFRQNIDRAFALDEESSSRVLDGRSRCNDVCGGDGARFAAETSSSCMKMNKSSVAAMNSSNDNSTGSALSTHFSTRLNTYFSDLQQQVACLSDKLTAQVA